MLQKILGNFLPQDQNDLFRMRLDQLVNMKHEQPITSTLQITYHKPYPIRPTTYNPEVIVSGLGLPSNDNHETKKIHQRGGTGLSTWTTKDR